MRVVSDTTKFAFLVFGAFLRFGSAFSPSVYIVSTRGSPLFQEKDGCLAQDTDVLVSDAAQKFKVVTCMSTSCSRRRKELGLDELTTFGALFSRAKESSVRVEEGPCVGSCKNSPCKL